MSGATVRGVNLATDPWIPVLTVRGMETMGLVDVFASADTVVDVATGDPLEDAALMRLLIACDAAAARSNLPAADWVDAHRHRFGLFDDVAPFGQNADMARFIDDPKAARTIAFISYSFVGNGSTALGDTHNEAGIRLTAAEATRMLLVLHAFAVGGRQSFSQAIYGPSAMAAKTAICTNRPFLWVQGYTLAESLELSRITADPLGEFHFTWPANITPASTGAPTGILDALTWPSRSMLLLRDGDGMVDRAMCCEGYRWPEVGKGDWTAEVDEWCLPYTTWTKAKPKEPFTIQGVHVDRPAWRQLLTAWSNPDSPGLLGNSPGHGTFRLIGLGSYQSRIDGPVIGSLPVPVFTRTDGQRLLDSVTEAYKSVASTSGSLASNMISASTDIWSKSATSRMTVGFPVAFERIVTDAAIGLITVDDACAAIATVAAHTRDTLIRQSARTRPLAAARTASRPAKGLST